MSSPPSPPAWATSPSVPPVTLDSDSSPPPSPPQTKDSLDTNSFKPSWATKEPDESDALLEEGGEASFEDGKPPKPPRGRRKKKKKRRSPSSEIDDSDFEGDEKRPRPPFLLSLVYLLRLLLIPSLLALESLHVYALIYLPLHVLPIALSGLQLIALGAAVYWETWGGGEKWVRKGLAMGYLSLVSLTLPLPSYPKWLLTLRLIASLVSLAVSALFFLMGSVCLEGVTARRQEKYEGKVERWRERRG